MSSEISDTMQATNMRLCWSQIWSQSIWVFPGYMQISVDTTPVQKVAVMHLKPFAKKTLEEKRLYFGCLTV